MVEMCYEKKAAEILAAYCVCEFSSLNASQLIYISIAARNE